MAKRGQGEGTISKRMVNGVWDGTWWARITVGKDENGKQKRKAFYCKTRQEVQKKLTEALNDVNNDTYIEPSAITLSSWLDIWLRDYKKHTLKPKTYWTYCCYIDKHIKPKLGSYKLKDLRTDIIQKFINDLGSNGLSASSVIKVFDVLSSALKQALDNELIVKNVYIKVKKPKKVKKEIRVLSLEEQQRFISAAQNTYLGEAFILMLGTGIRLGEAMALTWEDIDFEDSSLRVNKSRVEFKDYFDKDAIYHIEVGTPKTKASNRTLPLLPELVQMLKAMQKRQIELRLKMGEGYTNNNLLFCSHFGTPLYQSNMQRKFKEIVKKESIDGLHIHCLRHTFATRGLENGIELRVMQDLLGHSTLAMTSNTYTHVLPDKKKESIMKLKDTISL